jgi:Uma2 family endonuclease
MTPRTTALPDPPDLYPDSDGLPMSDNTLQFEWIVTLKSNLEALFQSDANVFVAGDLLWYPVQGHPEIRNAPDVLVAFGRPKGYRGSYRQWQEGGVAPQVVFEVLSPGNRPGEMEAKLEFNRRYGMEEYYIYDPHSARLEAYLRSGDELHAVAAVDGFTSPRLGVRFDLLGPELVVWRPDGQRFRTFLELSNAEQQAHARADRLAAKLRDLGIDPEQ